MSVNSKDDFINCVVKQVKFPFDRKPIAKELEDHIDQLESFFLSTKCSPDEAQRKAVLEMGDPLEVGRSLNDVHKPLLGWLWIFNKYLCILIAIYSSILFMTKVYTTWENSRERTPPVFEGESAFQSIGIDPVEIQIVYDKTIYQKIDLHCETILFERILLNSDGTMILLYQSIKECDPFGLDVSEYPIQNMSTLVHSNSRKIRFNPERVKALEGHRILVTQDESLLEGEIVLEFSHHIGVSRITIKGE